MFYYRKGLWWEELTPVNQTVSLNTCVCYKIQHGTTLGILDKGKTAGQFYTSNYWMQTRSESEFSSTELMVSKTHWLSPKRRRWLGADIAIKIR